MSVTEIVLSSLTVPPTSSGATTEPSERIHVSVFCANDDAPVFVSTGSLVTSWTTCPVDVDVVPIWDFLARLALVCCLWLLQLGLHQLSVIFT